MYSADLGLSGTLEGVWGADVAGGAHTGGDILCMEPDVPDLRSATADRSEGSWHGILLWVVLVRLFYGEGPHTAAAGPG